MQKEDFGPSDIKPFGFPEDSLEWEIMDTQNDIAWLSDRIRCKIRDHGRQAKVRSLLRVKILAVRYCERLMADLEDRCNG